MEKLESSRSEATIEGQSPNVPLTTEKVNFTVALAVSLVVLLVIAWPMFAGQLYTLDDLSWYHIPMRSFYAKCLADGNDPVWNPYVHCGYYLHGEGQVGMYHPLHRFLYGFLPFTEAFNVEVFLPYPLMLAGMYLFLRRWQIARDASMFGALVFTLSGFNLLHFIHVNAIATIAHIPWLFLAIDVYLCERGRRTVLAGAAVAVLVGSQVLLGYPQYVWFSSLAAGLYVLLLWPHWRTAPACVLLLVVLAVSGAMIGGVQLIPTFEVFRDSTRPNSTDYAADDLSLPPSNLLQFVGPYLYDKRIVTNHPSSNTHEYGLYTGAATSVLAFWFLCHAGGTGRKRRLAFGALALFVLSLVLATGRYGVLYTLVSRLPVVGWFRAPCRYIGLVHLSLAVIAGLAFETVRRCAQGQSDFRARLWPLCVLPVVGVIAVVMAGFGRFESWWTFLSVWASKDLRSMAAGPVLLGLAAIVVLLALRGWRTALLALVVFAAVDQAVYGLSYLRTGRVTSFRILADTVRMPPCPWFYRIEVVPCTDNVATLNGHHLVTGYTGLNPRKYLDYTKVDPLRLACAILFGVKADVTSEDGPIAGQVTFGEVDASMPRARLVASAVVMRDPKDAGLMLDGIDMETTALVEKELRLDAGIPGIAAVTKDLPGEIVIDAECRGRQLLVVSESHHRGWRARVDGFDAPVVRVYGDFLGVALDAGKHTIEFSFRPASLKIGRVVSLAGLVLAVMAVAAAARVTRTRG